MDNKNKAPILGVRHVQMFFMSSLMAIGIGMRSVLTVAVVAMTTKFTSPNPDVPVFDWNHQSVLLSSFYWGYAAFQLIAGNLGRLYGTKYFIIFGMIVNSTVCCILPTVAINWGSYGVIVCRVIQGFTQCFFFPNVNTVIGVWSPISERSRMGTLALAGGPLGAIVTMPVVGFISSTWYGWPLSFYLYGGIGYLWIILFFIFGASSPASHRSITQAEREYIESNLGTESNKPSIPWKKILLNPPFWAIFFSQVGQFWSNLTLSLETPTYLSKVTKFDITSNGFLSALPNLLGFVLLFVVGHIADYIINNKTLSPITTRKVFTVIGTVTPAVSLIILAFLPEDQISLSIAMLTVANALAAGCGAGSMINHIDLSPNFAGIMLSIINSCGAFISLFGPLLVQVLVVDESNKSEWTVIFLLAAAFFLVPTIFYVIFASADVQSFDSSYKEPVKDENQERVKKYSVISTLSL